MGNFSFNKVLYVPGSKVKLFSGGAAGTAGLESHMTEGAVTVSGVVDKELVEFNCLRTAKTSGGLYLCPFTKLNSSMPPEFGLLKPFTPEPVGAWSKVTTTLLEQSPEELAPENSGERAVIAQMIEYTQCEKVYRIMMQSGNTIERVEVIFKETADDQIGGGANNPIVIDEEAILIDTALEGTPYELTSDESESEVEEETTTKRPAADEALITRGANKYAKSTTRSGTIFSTTAHAGGGRLHRLEVGQLHRTYLASDIGDIEDAPFCGQNKINLPQRKQWQQAMDTEFNNLKEDNIT